MQHRLAARHGHQLQLSAFQSIVGLQQFIQLVAEQLRNYVALGEAESLGCYPFDLVIRAGVLAGLYRHEGLRLCKSSQTDQFRPSSDP
jgi:hypothetical protein